MYDLVFHPDERLREVCDPVTKVDGRVQTIVSKMIDTMNYGDRAVGLAAPQVGIMERLLVCDIKDGSGPRTLINPEVIRQSEETIKRTEGCLSLPDVWADVVRPQSITVRYTDERGAPQEWMAEGWWATVVQHEIDHLDGVLFTDYLSDLKREMVLKKYFKQMKYRE
ncbi:MAG: peptide deformylase [Bdellovibrionales bacterium]